MKKLNYSLSGLDIRQLTIPIEAILIIFVGVVIFFGCSSNHCTGITYSYSLCQGHLSDSIVYGNKSIQLDGTSAWFDYSCSDNNSSPVEGDVNCFSPDTAVNDWKVSQWRINLSLNLPFEATGCDQGYLSMYLEFNALEDGVPVEGLVFDINDADYSLVTVSFTLDSEDYTISSGKLVATEVSENQISFELQDLMLIKVSGVESANLDSCITPLTISIESTSSSCTPEVQEGEVC